MAKIPIFQQQRLASAAVGTPGVDKSAGTVSRLVGKAADKATDFVVQKQDTLNKTEANSRLLDFELALDETQNLTQKEFELDPRKGEREFANRALALQNVHSDIIENSAVRRVFTQASKGTVGAGRKKFKDFVQQQEVVNAVDSINNDLDKLSNKSLEAGKAGDFSEFSVVLGQLGGILDSGGSLLGTQQFKELDEDGIKRMAGAFITGMMQTQPIALSKLIEKGAFRQFLADDEVAEFRDDASKMVRRQQIIEEQARKLRHDEGLRDTLGLAFEGKMDILEVDFRLIDDVLSTRDHKSVRNSLIDGDIVGNKTDGIAYLELIDKVFDPDFDKAQFRSDVTFAYGQAGLVSILDAKDLIEFSTIIDADRRGNVMRGGVNHIIAWADRAMDRSIGLEAKREMIREFINRVNVDEDNDRVVEEKMQQVIKNKQRQLNPESTDREVNEPIFSESGTALIVTGTNDAGEAMVVPMRTNANKSTDK